MIGRCGPFELSFNGKLVESLNISTILSAGCELCADLILECSENACSGEVIYFTQKKEKQSIWRNWEYVLEGSAWFPSTVCNCNLM